MEIRFQHSSTETRGMSTEQLREHFLLSRLMVPDTLKLHYTHYDRMIVGGAMPVNKQLFLSNHPELRADYFLERREMGVINVGGPGKILVNQQSFSLEKLDCLYIGKGNEEVIFMSVDATNPAIFYLLSAPAHHDYPTVKFTKEQASPVTMGDSATANRRVIYKYIHAEGIQSCQLVMGLTVLERGSVWNSVPPHTHTRRMEVYFYFDLQMGQRIFHFMGEPQQTRHIVIDNNEAVLSPPWSVHFGAGTSNYGFIWGMAGENKAYTDMDAAPVENLK